jgi:hypothetical protein
MALVFDGNGVVTGFSYVASGDFNIDLPSFELAVQKSFYVILGQTGGTGTFIGITNNYARIRIRLAGADIEIVQSLVEGQTIQLSISRVGSTVTINENILGLSASGTNTSALTLNSYSSYGGTPEFLGTMTGVATLVGDAGGTITHDFEQSVGSTTLVDTTSGNNGTLSGFTTGGFTAPSGQTVLLPVSGIPDGTFLTKIWLYDNTDVFYGDVTYASGSGSIVLPAAAAGMHYGLVRDSDSPSSKVAPLKIPVGIVGYDVILLIGQSNMVGRFGPVSASLDPTDPRILQYGNGTSSVSLASDPLDNLDETSNTVGPGMSIARAHLATISSNRGVLLVPSADGGTSFGSGFWRDGGTGFETAITSANAALNYLGLDNKIVAMAWHQGESDRGMTETQYATDLDALIAAFRAEITGASSSPFIVGEVPTWSGQYGVGVAAALADTPDRVSNTFYVPTSDLPNDSGDGLHFSAASARLLGARYATKF